MSYAVAIESLLALGAELHTRPGEARRKFRLEDMRVLMAALGDPQDQYPSVLIAGTNGKGSTCATLASILNSAGYRTGRYTSPHLSIINERIQVGGAAIANEDFAAQYLRVHTAAEALVVDGRLPAHPSFFETVTAMALLYFAEQKVDIAVLEVGLGGRLDATNIVEPMVSILTDISLDHTEWLGLTISAIAREKAGILRRNGVLVTLPQHPEANQVIGEVAVPLHVRAVSATEYFPASHQVVTSAGAQSCLHNRYTLVVDGNSICVDSPLAGMHQQRNLALAIAAAVELRNSHGYNIADAAIEAGIRNTQWPGRLELIHGKENQPDVLLDVAHNPAGAWALRSALSAMQAEFDSGTGPAPAPLPLTLIFGCLADKAVGEIAQILFPLFDHVILVPVDSPRAASLTDLTAAAEATGADFTTTASAADALDLGMAIPQRKGLLVVTGSIVLVGAVRDLLVSRSARLTHPGPWNESEVGAAGARKGI